MQIDRLCEAERFHGSTGSVPIGEHLFVPHRVLDVQMMMKVAGTPALTGV